MIIGHLHCLQLPRQQNSGDSEAAILTGEQIIRRWADAIGGYARLSRVQWLHATYAAVGEGLNGDIERWGAADGRYHEFTNFPDVFREDDVLLGSRSGWVRDISGIPHPAGILKMRELNGDANWYTFAVFRNDRALRYTEAQHDHGMILLRVNPPNGDSYVVYFDADSFLPSKRDVYRGSVLRRSEYFSHWHDYQGIRLPEIVRVSYQNGDPDVSLTLRAVDINVEPPKDIFSVPTLDAPVVNFQFAFHCSNVKLQIWGVHPLIPTTVNASGTQLQLLLDTGGDLSYLSKERASALALSPKGSISTSGAGGNETTSLLHGIRFRIGETSVVTRVVGLIAGSGISRMWGKSFDGVLGYDVISRYVIKIDYGTSSIEFCDPAVFQYHGKGASLPISYIGNNITVPAIISVSRNRRFAVQLVVDTGSGSAITLRSPFVRRNGLIASVPSTIAASSAGVGEAVTERIGRMNGLQLGPYMLREPLAELSQATQGTEASSDVPGTLGGEILIRFTVYLDYPHGRVILEPNSRYSQPFEFDMSGMDLARDDEQSPITVGDVRPGSVAAKGGIEKGDILLRVDGQPSNGLSLPELIARLKQPGVVNLEFDRHGQLYPSRLVLRRVI